MAQYAGTLKPPFEFNDFNDFKDFEAAEDKWVEDLKAELRAKNKGDLVGEEVSWGAGDGYARYLIVKQKPLTLAHLYVGDGWHTHEETIRGFRLKDAKARVENKRKEKALREEQKRQTDHFYKTRLGKMVHYHDGFGQFVRCEVIQSEGEFSLRQVALVGAWKDYDLNPTSYHGRSVVEHQLMHPHISNIYEASPSLQTRFADPMKLAPLVIKGQTEMFCGTSC